MRAYSTGKWLWANKDAHEALFQIVLATYTMLLDVVLLWIKIEGTLSGQGGVSRVGGVDCWLWIKIEGTLSGQGCVSGVFSAGCRGPSQRDHQGMIPLVKAIRKRHKETVQV